MKSSPHHSIDDILVIIPVLNEEFTIAEVIRNLQNYGLNHIRVVDNGSSDRSREIAQDAGATVISESIQGYGQSCWRGLQNIPEQIEWILFCDGDGSDDLSCLPDFFESRQQYDFILGDRRATKQGRSVMTPVQKWGNVLATNLMNLGWGHKYRDLGPLRMIRKNALNSMDMKDRAFGWTVEMQVKAVEMGLKICELPVSYLKRQGGESKISGTIVGSFQAGTTILSTLGSFYFRKKSLETNPWFSLASGLMILIGAIVTAQGNLSYPSGFPFFSLGMAMMSIGFILSWGIKKINWTWFWTIAILARLALIPMFPGNDIWRYLWEGHIQLQGFSPYEFAPNAPELLIYKTDWWWQINHQGVSAIYPPLSQIIFRLLASISPTVIVFKSAFALVDLAICYFLVRTFSNRKVLLYAWNPLILYSFAGGGHYDSLFILPLVIAWLLFFETPKRLTNHQPSYKFLLGALCIGVSIAIKWISLPILAWVVWRAYQKVNFKTAILVGLIGVLPFILSSLFFCSPNACSLIPVDSDFVSRGRSATFIPYFLANIWQYSTTTNSIFAIPLGLGTLYLLWKRSRYYLFSQDYFYLLLLISPIIHGWYFTWIVPFGVATQNWGIRLLSISGIVYFMLPYREALGQSGWELNLLETLFLWLPFVVGYFWRDSRTSRLS